MLLNCEDCCAPAVASCSTSTWPANLYTTIAGQSITLAQFTPAEWRATMYLPDATAKAQLCAPSALGQLVFLTLFCDGTLVRLRAQPQWIRCLGVGCFGNSDGLGSGGSLLYGSATTFSNSPFSFVGAWDAANTSNVISCPTTPVFTGSLVISP